MSTEGSKAGAPGGLAHAQRELNDLMSELEQTLDLVNRLSDAGEDKAALSLLDHQRTELYRVMDSISKDVGRRRSFAEAMRSNLASVAAVTVLIVASVAASVVGLTRGDAADAASAEIDRAVAVTDVRERLVILVQVYERTRTLPAEQAAAVDADLQQALRETLEETSEGDDDPVVGEAEKAVHDLEEGRPPNPPTAPGTDKGPLETIQDLFPGP